MASCTAAAFDAKVSGREVPRATKVMAVVAPERPSEQPKSDARSPIKAVVHPIISNCGEGNVRVEKEQEQKRSKE